MGTRKEKAFVLSQEQIGTGIYSLWLQAEAIAAAAAPGQFVSLYSQDGSRLLPRPISLCEIQPEQGNLRLVYRIAGAGTREFSALQPGDSVEILGPLGNGFPIRPGRALVVGGGIGVPPLLELARHLPGEVQLVMGYRTGETYLEEELSRAGTLYLATEDGSRGTPGNVLDAIRSNHLSADVLYACGPLPMLRALKAFAERTDMEAWISLEERMACGIGACLACVCQSVEVDAHSQVKNKRVCKDGPVFNAREVEL